MQIVVIQAIPQKNALRLIPTGDIKRHLQQQTSNIQNISIEATRTPSPLLSSKVDQFKMETKVYFHERYKALAGTHPKRQKLSLILTSVVCSYIHSLGNAASTKSLPTRREIGVGCVKATDMPDKPPRDGIESVDENAVSR